MPTKLPPTLVVKRIITQTVSLALFACRTAIVALVWLVIVPYTTFLTWRTYFWFGDVMYEVLSIPFLCLADTLSQRLVD